MGEDRGDLNIYSFKTYGELLHSTVFRNFLNQRGKKSLRQHAQKLGYRSPRSVGMVLKGQRIPSMQMAHSLGRYFGFDENQQRYFELLILEERRRKSGKPTESLRRDLADFNPEKTRKDVLDDAVFSHISEWYHLVIKQLISVPGFRLDYRWIRDRLRKKVSAEQIQFAIRNLLRLGMVSQDAVTGKLRIVMRNVTTLNDIPSAAIRLHHRQMMGQALQALGEQGVEEREFTAATFGFDPKRMDEAKKLIRDFRTRMEALLEDPGSSDIYQLNIQFFAHTQRAQEKK